MNAEVAECGLVCIQNLSHPKQALPSYWSVALTAEMRVSQDSACKKGGRYKKQFAFALLMLGLLLAAGRRE